MTQELDHALDVHDHVLQRLEGVSDALVFGQAADLEQPAATFEALLRSLFAGDVDA